jgi:hypothetical protein
MISDEFKSSLSLLWGDTVVDLNSFENSDHEYADVELTSANGSRVKASYWRLLEGGRQFISSFDHQQKYGLPDPIDAKNELRKKAIGKMVLSAVIENKAGDTHFELSDSLELQVFNFTGYENWTVYFQDGTVEYANYNR